MQHSPRPAPETGRPAAAAEASALTTEPAAAGGLGVTVRLDVRTVTKAQARTLRQLVWRHKLVVLPGQDLTDATYIEFARALGTPQIYFQANYHHPDHPEIFVSSNVPHDGKKVGVAGTGRYWHTDCQFFTQPLPMTMVRPIVLPTQARGTSYIDMEHVLHELPDRLRPLTEGTRARHEARWRYKVQPCDVDKSITEILEEFGAITPTVTHPTVITHPVTGARCLYVSRGFTVGIEGRDDPAELEQLFDFIERESHVHTHPWAEGDVLLWDNRQLLHMASTVKGEPSESHRIGVYDGQPFCADESEGRLA